MTVITKENESALSILRKFLKKEGCTRWLHYCTFETVEDGVLVFNHMTREMVLLSQEEFDHFSDLDYLKEHWFVVPEETKEREYANLIKWVLSNRQQKSKEISGYTIFTTTDCNARCFYCFELGRSRIPMSSETAEKVVEYIKNHCGGKSVRLAWFGGEPLFNIAAIDTIISGLCEAGIEYHSNMVSNGYLFDDETVSRAVNQWNLKHVQITLDGTEEVYNKTKAFIYSEGNPYEIVMSNIHKLLHAGVRVTIRLNMDIYNAEDLLILAEELAERFAGKKGFHVYAHYIFKGDTPDAELHSEEEWEKREVAMNRLTDCLDRNDLLSKARLSKTIRLNHCMADSGRSVTILPDGNIGLCEHFTETEFIGNIGRADFDASMVASWKETMPEIPDCEECFYFPDCIKLKKCASSSVCYHLFRREKLKNTRRAMVWEYQRWQKNAAPEEEEEADFC